MTSAFAARMLGSLYGSVPGRDDNQFVVLSVQHEASNNLGSEAAELLKSNEFG